MRTMLRWGVRCGGLLVVLALAGCREDALAPARQLGGRNGLSAGATSGGLNPTTIYLGDVGPGVNYWVQPYAISSNGQWIGGSVSPVQLVNHGFVWHGGVMTDVGLLASAQGTGTSATVYDVNSSGVAVGTAEYLEVFPCLTTVRAFVWSNGVMSQLPPLPGDCYAEAFGINDGGDVVGYSRPFNSSMEQPVLWHNGVPQAIGAAGSIARGTRISNAGYVLVNGFSRVFGSCFSGTAASLWVAGQSVTLPATFCGRDVGEDGTVVGDDAQSAAAWKNGITTILSDPTAPMSPSQGAGLAINSSGEILVAGRNTPTGIWSNGRLRPLDRDVEFLQSLSLSDGTSATGMVGNQSPPWVTNHGYLVPYAPSTSDYDLDGLPDAVDRCPFYPSSNNADFDLDGIGDVCDPTPGADLSLTFGGTPPPFVLNQQATVQLLEANIGPGGSTGATVIIPPSPGFKFLSATGATCAPVGGNLRCTLGALPLSNQAPFALTVLPIKRGTFAISLTLAGNETDTNQANNVIARNVRVQ